MGNKNSRCCCNLPNSSNKTSISESASNNHYSMEGNSRRPSVLEQISLNTSALRENAAAKIRNSTNHIGGIFLVFFCTYMYRAILCFFEINFDFLVKKVKLEYFCDSKDSCTKCRTTKY